MLYVVFLGPWLGHGRRLDCFIITAMFLYGLQLLIFPNAILQSQINYSLITIGLTGTIPGALFLTNSLISGTGLLMNIFGLGGVWSNILRIVGGLCACFLHVVSTVLYIEAGAFATLGACYVAPAIYFCMGTVVMSWANVPASGAPGAK